MVTINRLWTQIQETWQHIRISHQEKNLWLGIVVPSFFINLLMLALPLAMLQTYDRIIPNASTKTLVVLIFLVICAAIIEVFLRALRGVVSSWSFTREEYLSTTTLLEKILYSILSPENSIEKQSLLTYSDVINRVKQINHEQFVINFLDLFFIIIFIGLIAYIGGLLVIVPIVLMILLALKIYKRSSNLNIYLQRQKENDRERISLIVDSLSGIFTLKALAMEPSILRRSEYLQLKKAEANYDINLSTMAITALVAFFSQFVFFLTVSAGALFVIYGSLTIGGLAACILLSGRIMQPIARFISLYNQQQDIHSSQKYLKKIYSLTEEPFSEKTLHRIIKGKITFDHVSLKEKNRVFVEDVFLEIFPEETVVIKDPYRACRYLFYFVMNFSLPTQGKVLIDNIQVSEYNLHNLRQQICYMPHEGVLYNGTILENITGFDPSKEILAREIAMHIGLEHMISKLPQGFQTRVGPNAVQMFSNGFRQLIALVRILINKPKIILFDHITMNVDHANLRMIVNALNLYKGKITLFFGTTDPMLLTLTDRIYTLINHKLE